MGNIKKALLNVAPYILVRDKIQNTANIGREVGTPPELYNSYGERMKVFFLRDSGCMHTPYTLSSGRTPRNILWDRYNIALKTHFYIHENIFDKTYACNNKIGVLRESEEIIPEYYALAMKKPEVIGQFTKILTHSERILDRYENAEFAPACSVWYGTKTYGGNMSSDNYQRKTKNISVIASAKEMCELHRIRGDIARHYKNDPRVDAFGAAVGNYIPHKADALENYRYSIVLENSVTSYYFTEKILDCFASMTVPIYVGATKIDEFFNADGIIKVDKRQLSDLANIDKIVNFCGAEDYLSRIDAIIDNYKRVQDYLCYEDYIYNKYPEFN